MTEGRRSLAERLARRQARFLPAVDRREEAESAPAREERSLPPPGEEDPGGGGGSIGIGEESSADETKAARLRRARALLRNTERGWKDRRPAQPLPAGSLPARHPTTRTSESARHAASTRLPPAGRHQEPFSREEHDFPLAARYGGAAGGATLEGLAETGEPATARLQIHREQPGVDFARTLFLDTETSGLAGGTGTFAFLVGVGRVVGEQFRITQLLLQDPGGERAMLEQLAALAADGPDLVTYNGKGFDLPLLDTRFALNGLPNPLAGARHLDLLHPARRLFFGRHESARLGVLERELLGVEREDDIPGDQIPGIFFASLRNGPHPAMESVLAHNRYDLRTLAALALRAAEHTAAGWNSDDPAYLQGVGHHFFRRGEPEAAIPLLSQALEAGLTGPSRERCLLDLGEHRKRSGDWEGALRLWDQVRPGDTREKLEALVWFAKWEEHRRKDPAAALAHVEDALELLPRVGMQFGTETRFRLELEERARRLRGKRRKLSRR